MLRILCWFRRQKRKKKIKSLINKDTYTNDIPDHNSISINSLDTYKQIKTLKHTNDESVLYKSTNKYGNISVLEAFKQYELNKEYSRLSINSIIDSSIYIIYEEETNDIYIDADKYVIST